MEVPDRRILITEIDLLLQTFVLIWLMLLIVSFGGGAHCAELLIP